MIAVEHEYALPSSDFACRQTELRSPSLLVIRRRLRNGRYSDRVFDLASRRGAPWPCVRLVLSGAAVATVGDETVRLGPGDAVVGDRFNAVDWTITSDESDTLLLSWPEGAACGAGILPAHRSGGLAAQALRLARSMGGHVPRPIAITETVKLFAVLAAQGVVDDPRPIVESLEEAPEHFARFAIALGAALSQTSGWPMTVDLACALGIGERQVTRLASAYFRSLYLSVDSLGAYLGRSRMWLATAAMTNPEARTEEVARHFGFSSPVALCHAFSAAGLPSPRLIRRAVLDREHAA